MKTRALPVASCTEAKKRSFRPRSVAIASDAARLLPFATERNGARGSLANVVGRAKTARMRTKTSGGALHV